MRICPVISLFTTTQLRHLSVLVESAPVEVNLLFGSKKVASECYCPSIDDYSGKF